MFLKRSLVMFVGVLLFIGAFLLKFRLSDAHLENVFKNERVKYGVEGVLLTLPEAAPPALPAPPPPVSTSSNPSTATSGPPLDTSVPAAIANPAPGSTADPNVIIGPMPPASSAPSDNDTTPLPVPSPDTNGAPMMPPSSGMNLPRRNASPFLLDAAYRPPEWAVPFADAGTAQATQSGPSASNPGTAVSTSTNSGAMSKADANPAPAPAGRTENVTAPAAPVHTSGGRAIILGFHQFTAPGVPSGNIYSMRQDIFAGEMKYLRDNGFNVVPLSDVVGFIEHKETLPPNAVAITIDDGYKSALNYAAPVLKEYGYPWTYFVYPAFITRTEGKGAASWPDLLELEKEGVDVESHSMTHPKLSSHKQYFTETPAPGGGPPIIKYQRFLRILSPQEYDDFLTNETLGAKQLLEKELGKKIKYLAYPYGDYNKAVEAKAIAAGYEAIFTVAGNPVHITTSVHSIGRYIVTKPDEPHYTGFLHQGALSLSEADPSPGATTSNPRPVITAVLGFNGLAASLETEVNGFVVPHDFDPQTSTVRLYLQRDLVQPEVIVSVRAKDAQSGQTMVSNWHFNYEAPGGGAATVPPGPTSTMPAKGNSNVDQAVPPKAATAVNAAPIAVPASSASPATNAPAKNPATAP